MNNNNRISQIETTPYRILHCIDNLGRGGSETQLIQTLLSMDRTRFKNYVCYLNPPSDLEEAIVRAGLPITNLHIGNQHNWFRAMRGISMLIRQHHIQLIHASTSYSNLYAPLVGVIKHIPVIFTLNTTYNIKDHVQALHSFLKRWRLKIFFGLRSLILRATKSTIIAVSNATKESAIKYLGIPADRISVVYRGLVPENYATEHFSLEITQKAKEELNITNAFPILINVGRLWSVKNQKDLVQAMPVLLKSYPKAKLLIAGQGPLKTDLEELRDRLGLKDCVKLLGLRQDIPLLLAISHIFVAASYHEGFGNVVAEAMAAGKPVVAYDIPVLNEMLKGETGILVEFGDHELLANEIAHLAADPEKMKIMGSRGIQIVRDKFDIRHNTRQLENIYERILNRVTRKKGKL
jgi:glycosyltransferase involved in cell wall biosynthesis